MKPVLDLESLSHYCLVVQEGSFTGAAKKLTASKATVSRNVALLEESLGVQLLIRTTRSLRTTEIGRDFYHRALGILGASDEAVAAVTSTTRDPSGLLRIAAGVEFGTEFVMPKLTEYLKLHPQVQAELELSGRFIDLVHEGFDVGIRIGALDDSTLSSRKLGSLRYGLYASPEFLKQYPIRKIETLKQVPALIFNRPGHHSEWTLLKGETERSLKVQARMISNNQWSLRTAAIAGLGITFSPTILMNEAVRSKKLVHVLPEWTSPEIPIHAVFPSQRYLAPKVRSFVDHLARTLTLSTR
ncbi:MAG: LysR family transcriptional regulator [Bdellovibrionales bacterium]|nr:LysR family transcriptional regulator [Bdellovibrionales bacterium]